ncbi:MAG: DUF3662 domain-containing protein [Myxococcota bacterium]|nr:DUF3662 domain-containing protein [Myxococcota bacterium]
MGVIAVEPDRFRVEFARLEEGGVFGRLKGMLSRPAVVTVDPFRVGRAVCAVMSRSTERDVHGRLLAWNEYRVYLSRADYDRLRPLRGRLSAGLDTIIRKSLADLGAQTVGDPVVRVLFDEEADLEQGVGEIVVAYVNNADIAAPTDAEVTVRVRAAAPPRQAEHTERVIEPEGPGSLRVAWGGGTALIASGRRMQLGRPHGQPPENFIALSGASNRINSVQLTIENGVDGVVVSRPVRANPVQIAGRLLQPGGRMVLSDSAVEIVLSNGELTVSLSRLT